MNEPVLLAVAVVGFACYLVTLVWRARRHVETTHNRLLFVDVLLVIAGFEVVADAMSGSLFHAEGTWAALTLLAQGAIVTGGIVLFLTRNEP